MRGPWRLARILVLICSVLLVSPRVSAQLPNLWEPISRADLELKDNPANPGSSAMILERQIYTDDEKRFQTEFVRIKILAEEGRAYADVLIPYLAKNTSISDIRGRTVRPDGTVINFDGTVFDNIVVKYKKFRFEAKTFTLPGVDVGSVIEYAYTVRWKEAVPDVVRNPKMYIIDRGLAFPTTVWTVQHELFTRHASFSLRPVNNGDLHWAKIRLSNAEPSRQPDGTIRMDVSDVPALQHEEYMPAEAMINSRVHFYYAVGNYVSAWEEYGKEREQSFQKLIDKTKSLERAAEEIAPASDPPETRLRKLYARVQQIRYLSAEPSKTRKEVEREHLAENKSAEDVLRHGYGYGNEINFLFTALARAAGFDASIVELADRRSGEFNPQAYDYSQLNAIVVLVEFGKRKLYFDPATQFCPYGELPWYEEKTSGVRWNKLGGVLVNVDAEWSRNDTIERDADLKLQPDGGLEGTLNIDFTGQEALDRRLQAFDEDEAGRRTLVEEEIKGWLPLGATIDVDSIQGWQASQEPLRVKCRFHAPRFAVFTQKRVLFPTSVFQINRKIPLPHAYRTFPANFGHGYKEIDRVTISIPAGYRVEALPDESAADTPFASFNEKRTQENGIVHLERHTELKQFSFAGSSYNAVRQYFQQLRKIDTENVVLHAEAAQTR